MTKILSEIDELENLIKHLTYRKKVEKMPVSKFIKNHNHINYCEAIINREGLIGYVKPSHIYSLIAETGMTDDEVYDLMPASAIPINWLVEYTGCCSVWYEGVICPSTITSAQKNTLKLLRENKIIK